MKLLTRLGNNPAYIDRYVTIRNRKHTATRSVLVAAHPLIEGRYAAYENALAQGTLASLPVYAGADALKQSLRACYDVPTLALTALKKAIKAAQPPRLLKYCPMCGTTLPSTFDHYLPAVRFPEFSVHALNLVPCCATCNSTKDDDWLCDAGRRQFLHAYADSLPDLQFLHVALHQAPGLQGVGATFSLARPTSVADDVWLLISKHYERLRLIARYDDGGNDELAEILANCRTYRDAGGQDVQAFLFGQAADRSATYGRNNWIAVLMTAMANHIDLESWVNAASP